MLIFLRSSMNLADNKLNGVIPTEFGELGVSEDMRLGSNKLVGTLPTELGRMTRLGYGAYLENDDDGDERDDEAFFDLSRNDIGGAIPTQLGRLTRLTSNFLLH